MFINEINAENIALKIIYILRCFRRELIYFYALLYLVGASFLSVICAKKAIIGGFFFKNHICFIFSLKFS